jgi:hypothetical protein
MDALSLRRYVVRIIEQVEKERGKSGVMKAQIPAAFGGGGNPTLQLANETAAQVGPKTHRIIQPFSNRSFPPSASQSVAHSYDPDNNRMVAGLVADSPNYRIDSDLFMGMNPVAPGNTLKQSADTERSTNSSTFVKLKEFYDPRPGKWRLTFELARSGGNVRAVVMVRYPDQSGSWAYLAASVEASLATTTYPSFSVKTLDMTEEQPWGGSSISIWVLNESGPSQTGYIRNAKLKYAEATQSLSPSSFVLLD